MVLYVDATAILVFVGMTAFGWFVGSWEYHGEDGTERLRSQVKWAALFALLVTIWLLAGRPVPGPGARG